MLISLLLAQTNVALVFARLSSDFLSGANLSPGTQKFAPNSSSVEQRWNIYAPPSYSLAVKPVDVQDLQTIIRAASVAGVPFLATGGGHGLSKTLGGIDNGLDIDLGNFRNVSLDIEKNLLTIGGGTEFSAVFDLLYNAGKQLPIVATDCIGMLGATLAGGVGILQGVNGLLLDSLISVKMVTARGELVTASEKINPGLFWALRGAGHNFGVVTTATYKVHESTNKGQMVNADFLFSPAQNGSVWQYMKSIDHNLPAEMAVTFFVSRDPRVPGNSTAPPLFLVNVAYLGPQQTAMKYLAPLIALEPALTNITMIPFNDIFNAIFFGQDNANSGGCAKGVSDNIYGIALKQTDVDAWVTHFNDLVRFFIQYPTYQGRLLVQRYPNQAALAVPDAATAYSLREAKIHVNLEGFYTDKTIDAAVNQFLSSARTRFQATSGFPELAVYLGYARGDEGPVGWYSRRKLALLEPLKQLWDRDSLFRWYNPIFT